MIPLSLYIHFPWCVKKCPYCDFNSHQKNGLFDEEAYVRALLRDFEQDYARFGFGRKIKTVFMGGGTPSLFSGRALVPLFEQLRPHFAHHDIEITLEANPGTIERDQFAAYFDLGINRISLGMQSFNSQHLKILGRIHSATEVDNAIAELRKAGFVNFNLDLMHGLPGQTCTEALQDLQTALAFAPSHLSWYQLTLEPNTYFAKYPPKLPADEALAEIEQAGLALLAAQGFQRYEISAFAHAQHYCQHNLNYWQFGDYLGIGAGAHGKITDVAAQKIYRSVKYKLPKAYLDPEKAFLAELNEIPAEAQTLEFMLNALRLIDGFNLELLTTRTFGDQDISASLNKAVDLGLLTLTHQQLKPSARGLQYLNDLINLF